MGAAFCSCQSGRADRRIATVAWLGRGACAGANCRHVGRACFSSCFVTCRHIAVMGRAGTGAFQRRRTRSDLGSSASAATPSRATCRLASGPGPGALMGHARASRSRTSCDSTGSAVGGARSAALGFSFSTRQADYPGSPCVRRLGRAARRPTCSAADRPAVLGRPRCARIETADTFLERARRARVGHTQDRRAGCSSSAIMVVPGHQTGRSREAGTTAGTCLGCTCVVGP